jgi:CTP synthase
VLVEHARNVLRIADAQHRESTDDGTPIVSQLACSLADDTIEIALAPGTRTARLYGAPDGKAVEQTTCNYGLNPEHAHIAHEGGMTVTATDDTGEVRAVERTDHPFFVATLYQPQLSSAPGAPHPLLRGFVEACATRD